MLGNFNPAVFADGQDAVIIQESLRAGLFIRLDHVLEQHPFLNLGRNGL